MKPKWKMYGYEVYPHVSDFVRGLSPNDLKVWRRRVSQFAGAMTLAYGRLNASLNDDCLWVPRELTLDELAEILAKAEESVRGWQERFRPRVYGGQAG